MILIAPGLRYRHLEVHEVLARAHARSVAEVAAHNASVTADAAQRVDLREFALSMFTPAARRLAR